MCGFSLYCDSFIERACCLEKGLSDYNLASWLMQSIKGGFLAGLGRREGDAGQACPRAQMLFYRCDGQNVLASDWLVVLESTLAERNICLLFENKCFGQPKVRTQ